MTKGHAARYLWLAGAAALVAGPALAQDAGAPGTATPGPVAAQAGAPDGLEDIVVTAERRETNLQDTPISVSAVTAATIQAQGIRTVSDLAANIPNLTSTTGPQGSADANFFIRGVGQFDFIATNDPGVGVYVDGIYLGRTVGALLDSSDIARIEVLRGPQGTLFGRNTLGGAVSITSKAPEIGDLSGTVSVSGGSRNRIDADGSINLPLGDHAAARFGAFERYQDGFATRAFDGAKFGKTKRYGGRAQLLLKPTERLSLTLSADYSNDKSNPAPSVLLAIVPAPFFPAGAAAQIQNPNAFYTVNESNSTESRNEIYGFSGTLAFEVADHVTLKSITAYRHLDAFSTSDPDGTLYRLYDQQAPTKQNQFSEELQLAGTAFNDRLSFVLGGYYFHEKVDQTLFLCFAPITPTPTAFFNPCNTWNQGNVQTTESFAGFGQARFNLTDRLSVTLGGRYTSETKDDISNQAFDFRPAGLQTPGGVVPGFFSPIVTNLPGHLKFTKFTPKVGVEYKPSNNLLIYASYAQGFRSGGFNGRLIVPTTVIPSFRPDTNDAFEIGFKADALDKRVRLNATAFYSKYKGIQQTISVPVTQFQVSNAGNAELYGFEAELTVVPAPALRFNASVGYTHSQFQDVPASAEQSGRINGNSLPFSPRFTVSTGVEYRLALGDHYKLIPRVDYRLQSRTYFTALNLPLEQQKTYGLLQTRLTLAEAHDRYSLAVYADNLTDERYYTFGQNALGAQGVAYNYLGRPREFGVTGRVNF